MTTTTEEQIDQQLRHLPPRFDALRALLAAYAGTLKVVLNATELDFIPSTTIGGAVGPFLTLIAKGYGIRRASGEADSSLRLRVRNVDDSQTVSTITDAVDALLAPLTGVTSVLIEHWAAPLVVDTDDLDFALVADNGSLYDTHNAFTLIIPDFGDDTDPIYAVVINEVERLRAAGVTWFLILEGAP